MSKASIYSSLETERSIRILVIHPGAFADHIRCNLKDLFLDAKPIEDYEALSYVWGPAEPRQWITVNSIPKSVTPNLATALRRLRSENTSRRMWVDALCINQDDLGERTQQVQLMREVYSKARRTIIWLGEEGKDTAIGISIIDTAGKECKAESGKNLPSRPFNAEKNRILGFPPQRDPTWQSAVEIFQRPWFERVWVIQEAAVSVNPMVVIGTQQIPWLDLWRAATWFSKHGYGEDIPTEYLEAPMRMRLVRLRQHNVSLPRLLDLGKTFQATDLRDKVFALFGLSKESADAFPCFLLLPNYRKPLLNVFVDVVKHLLECPHTELGRNLEVLSSVFHGKQYTPDPHFPSWVPRWDIPGASMLIYQSGTYFASRSRAVQVRDAITATKLVLRGFKVSIIRYLNFDLVDLWFCNQWSPESVWLVVKSIWMSVIAEQIAYTGSDLGRAIGKTLSVGFPETTEADFTAYCQEELRKEKANSSISSVAQLHLDSATNPHSQASQHHSFVMPECDPLLLAQGDANQMTVSISARPIFTTSSGQVGTGQNALQIGDIVCVLFGGDVPFVLRAVDDYYILIGECYVYGLMEGQAMTQLEAGEFEEEWFALR